MKRVLLGLLFMLLSWPSHSRAQATTDSLRLTLPQAEDQFRQHNLSVMATRLGIDEYRAYQAQARLVANPTIYVEQMPYNRLTREFMPVGQNNSQQVVQVQQLLVLAGKRNKQLALASTNTKIATDRFEDVVRTLTYQLRSAFYDLYYQQQALAVYQQESNTLSQTVALYQQQYDKGNVPLKDLTRLKAYLFNLANERQQRLSQIVDDQATLAVLLNVAPDHPIRPVVAAMDPDPRRNPATLSLDSLVALAQRNRARSAWLSGPGDGRAPEPDAAKSNSRSRYDRTGNVRPQW
jgi:outer membrane protein, heavy metal efflux system